MKKLLFVLLGCLSTLGFAQDRIYNARPIPSSVSNALTADALSANPTDCAADQYAKAIDAAGNLTCETVTKATALAADPADCAADNFATAINASGTLTCGQPSISAGVSGLGANVATFLAIPSSANLAAAVTDETGSGALVFGTNPAFTTSISTPSIITASGALGITPAAGSGVNITLSTTGDFAINTNQLYVDTSAAMVGIGMTNPTRTLDVTGTFGATGAATIGGVATLSSGFLSSANSTISASSSNSVTLTITNSYAGSSSWVQYVSGGGPSANGNWGLYNGADRFNITPAGAAIFTGTLAVTGSTTSTGDFIRSAAVSTRGLFYQTSGSNRWVLYTNGTAESGSNAGSNFAIAAYNDAAGGLGDYFTLNRATAAAAFSGTLAVTGAYYSGATIGCTGVPTASTLGIATTCTSDERMKDIRGPFTRGLAALQTVNPIIFTHKSDSGQDPKQVWAGFSAQNVQKSIPEAVWSVTQGDGKEHLTLSDRTVLAVTVNAIKELNAKVTAICSRNISIPECAQ